MKHIINKKIKEFGLCIIWAFTILFFVSADSYTHDLYYRWDSSWFFTCGKAWVEGLHPYIDFADSKGPILWLINALAYILSPYNYLGVFWLSVISYALVFYIDYKIALLFLKKEKLSWIVVIILPIAYFNPWYHFETSAECWCQPFISLVIYRILRLIVLQNYCNKELCITGFILGIGVIWTFLIKFSITIMIGISECYCLYIIIREKGNFFKALSFWLLGVFFIAAPITLYLFQIGSLEAFITEYLINTMKTISSPNPIEIYLHEWLHTFANAFYATLFFICLIGCFHIGKTTSKDRLFLIFSFLGFYSIAIHHNIHRHYLNSCLFFVLFFIIYLVYLNREKLLFLNYIKQSVFSAFFLFFIIMTNWTHTEGFFVPNLFFLNNQDRKDYYTVAYYMAQIPHPTILYYRFAERGYGTPSGALPASKYWSTQTNPTQEMLDLQHEDAISRKADFIISYQKKENDDLFSHIGYIKLYEFGGLALYSKQQLKGPSDSFNVSNIDVLLKRDKLAPIIKNQH